MLSTLAVALPSATYLFYFAFPAEKIGRFSKYFVLNELPSEPSSAPIMVAKLFTSTCFHSTFASFVTQTSLAFVLLRRIELAYPKPNLKLVPLLLLHFALQFHALHLRLTRARAMPVSTDRNFT